MSGTTHIARDSGHVPRTNLAVSVSFATLVASTSLWKDNAAYCGRINSDPTSNFLVLARMFDHSYIFFLVVFGPDGQVFYL
jgi:hypothetical protein